ncbi:TPA: VOC family protein [Legionella feeleii]|uniref:Bleomycin resistance protein n=1 Tax=Legionella feeleii TaxID=453 RepID=A0A378IUM2_9GAMM|nr:VOC family protein [Legionella feeleii]STX38201.1 bleomycin resistance protein [Legionella feeleii]
MLDPNFIILYVNKPSISSAFYTKLLNKQPVESSANFVMFVLNAGVKLGLWSKDDVKPEVTAASGSTELAIAVNDDEQVRTVYDEWKKQGLTLIQPPTPMDFGLNFVALDPDGHRIRVFTQTY